MIKRVPSEETVDDGIRLHVQRYIEAPPERVFRAWTDARELQRWWGPQGVKCLSAEIDLTVGGHYRIENQLEDGSILWIAGTFDVIEKPHLLVYTWVVENDKPAVERVEVRFVSNGCGTDISIQHDKIASRELRERHQLGWFGCLDGLSQLVEHSINP